MKPLRDPEKPAPPQKGDIYEKRNAGNKTTVNAPRIRIAYTGLIGVEAVPINFCTGHGWKEGHWFKYSGRRMLRFAILDRDWRKVSFVEESAL